MKAIIHQSSATSRDKGNSRAIRASLTALSFAVFVSLSASPAKCFAQTARKIARSEVTATVNRAQSMRLHKNLLPAPPDNPPGDGAPPSGGGSGSGGSSGSSPTITYFDRNTTSHTAQLQFSNGAHVTVDTEASKVYVYYAGQSKSFSLDEVLKKAANGNASVAAQTKAELISKLSTPIGNARFQSLGDGASQANSRTHPRSLMPPNSTYVHPDLMPTHGPGGYLPPFECDFEFTCDYRDVSYDGLDGGGYGFWYFDTNSPSASHGQDWYYWNRWRQDHCEAAKENAEDAGLAVTTMVASSFGGLVGLIGVAAGAIAVIVAMNHQADNERVCLSKYPGKNNW